MVNSFFMFYYFDINNELVLEKYELGGGVWPLTKNAGTVFEKTRNG